MTYAIYVVTYMGSILVQHYEYIYICIYIYIYIYSWSATQLFLYWLILLSGVSENRIVLIPNFLVFASLAHIPYLDYLNDKWLSTSSPFVVHRGSRMSKRTLYYCSDRPLLQPFSQWERSFRLKVMVQLSGRHAAAPDCFSNTVKFWINFTASNVNEF